MDKSALIYKVLSGDATATETAALNAWISNDPSRVEEFEDFKLLYENSLDIEKKINERDDHFYEGLRNIQARIKVLKRKKKERPYKIAATSVCMATLILLVLISFWDLKGKSEPAEQSANTNHRNMAQAVLLTENLSFEDATLESVLDILEEKYNLIFKVSSKDLLSCRFTGTFYRGITIDHIVRTLAQSEDFNYTFVNSQTYQLDGKGCSL